MPADHSSPSHYLIPALGLVQIVAWGSMFYGYGVLMQPMQHGLGLATPVVFGAYSLALLISGLLSSTVSSLIAQIGGRLVITGGGLLAALMFVCLAQVQTILGLYVVCSVIGVAMSATLYQPAFAILTQVFGENYRRAITHLTLFGGFASTVFWPLTQMLLEKFGWREIWLIYAAAIFIVCISIYHLLPGKNLHLLESGGFSSKLFSNIRSVALEEPIVLLITLAIALNAFVFSGMSLHMIPMLQERGITAMNAAVLSALVGPMQVLSRTLETTIGSRFSTRQMSIAAISLLPISLLVLPARSQGFVTLIIFVALYGISNGFMVIIRSTWPVEVCGRVGSSSVSGVMSVPAQLAIAAGPFFVSCLHSPENGYRSSILVLAGVSAGSAILFGTAIAYSRR
ncbi:TPA: MFS transporter [Pseudomonas aeruginosa]|nr:MFS transporter [Pseudomonas aeruginosa]